MYCENRTVITSITPHYYSCALYHKATQGEESLVALNNYELEDVFKSTSTNALSSRTTDHNEKRKDIFQEKGTKGATLIVSTNSTLKSTV